MRFREEVEARFGFLSEHGFAGPVTEDHTVEYVSERLSIRVTLDGHQHELVTTISAMGLHAGLSCLYVEAGLGRAQAIGEIARTGHSLAKTVTSQGVALEALLPQLASDRLHALMASCHGR